MSYESLTRSVFGWCATAFSLTYKIPQIYTLCREKNHKGLSVVSLICQGLAYGFYIVHGYFNNDLPILFMGVISGLQSLCLIILYYVYKTDKVED